VSLISVVVHFNASIAGESEINALRSSLVHHRDFDIQLAFKALDPKYITLHYITLHYITLPSLSVTLSTLTLNRETGFVTPDQLKAVLYKMNVYPHQAGMCVCVCQSIDLFTLHLIIFGCSLLHRYLCAVSSSRSRSSILGSLII
jgi:hypothetical protein